MDEQHSYDDIKTYEGVIFRSISCDHFRGRLTACKYFGLAADVTIDMKTVPLAQIKKAWKPKVLRPSTFRLNVDGLTYIEFEGHFGDKLTTDSTAKTATLRLEISPPVREHGKITFSP